MPISLKLTDFFQHLIFACFFWKNDDLFVYIDLLNTNLLMTLKAWCVLDINILTTQKSEIQYTILINYL